MGERLRYRAAAFRVELADLSGLSRALGIRKCPDAAKLEVSVPRPLPITTPDGLSTARLLLQVDESSVAGQEICHGQDKTAG